MTDEERLRSDARGVSEVVGSILVFGLLISLIAILQTQAVPVANEDVEFNHNEEVQGDLIQYQEAASRTAAQGTTETVGITMGTTYPSRLVFFNPRDPSGTIRTVGNETARVQNVNATSPIIRENYIDNETDALETKRLEYTPNYNEFENPPRNVLEYGIQYEDFGETTIVNNRGNVVNGNNIDLTFFAGELSRTTSSALSLDASPASAPARTVTVTPDNENDPVEITLPSGLDDETWEEDVLAPELEPDGNVLGVVDGASPGTVTIRLNGSVNRYTLRMPVIGVGSGVEQPAARYVFSPEGRRGTAPIDSPREVTFEIRDKYNNPVRGEAVFFAEGAGFDGTLVANRLRTDAEGRVSVLYEAPDEAGIDDTI